ncbi:MAG: transglutaminase [Methylocystis sp.]|nr:MAG: transglutaminase [Methylocystis sp.]
MCVLRRVSLVLAVLIGALGLSSSPVSAARSPAPHASAAPLGPETSVPFGWVEFCKRYAAECDEPATAVGEIALDAAALGKIKGVNALVNHSVEPVSDSEHVGVIDSWDYPSDGKGDCEDYALMKRRLLIDAGFARGALLLTVVKDQHGDGHSVLMVRTSRGDFVLDNLNDEVKPWTGVPYRFVKRQSQESPNVWVSIGAPTSAPMYVAK